MANCKTCHYVGHSQCGDEMCMYFGAEDTDSGGDCQVYEPPEEAEAALEWYRDFEEWKAKRANANRDFLARYTPERPA